MTVLLVHDLSPELFRSDPLRQHRAGIVRATNRALRELRPWCDAVAWLSRRAPLPPELLPGLDAAPGDWRIERPGPSAFFGTDLAARIGERATVVLAGIHTYGAVRDTAIDAHHRGHAVRLAVDACAADDDEHESITLRYLDDEEIARVRAIASIAEELRALHDSARRE